jgi:serine O-acetyltransferase
MRNLRRDFERFFHMFRNDGKFSCARRYFSAPQYKALIYYRLCRIYSFPGLRSVLHWNYRRHALRSGVELGCPVGGGLIIPHWGSIKLNAVSIGCDAYILHNVTIGDDFSTGMPTVGDNVFIGTGSTIAGGITIGDNVVIGAMSYVNENVPSNTIVAGIPARHIRDINADHIHQMTGY